MLQGWLNGANMSHATVMITRDRIYVFLKELTSEKDHLNSLKLDKHKTC